MLAYADDANQAVNCQKYRLILLNLQRLFINTERYQSILNGASIQRYSPY
jgi:hypothetical protein